ncbi:MAG: phosphate ABC transporter permease subunit PstC [Candidatus Binatia bacterium]
MLLVVLHACGIVVGVIPVLIVGYVCAESAGLVSTGGLMRFFTDTQWLPRAGQFNIVPLLVTSLIVTLGAMSIASLVGICLGVFIVFYAPVSVGRAYTGMLGLLAGIPSVVYGLWGLTVLIPHLNRLAPPGFSVLMGVVILAIMILPTVTLLTATSLRTIPRDYVLGAYALGLTQTGVLWRVVLPAARRGIIVGALLALMRALGETMALSMVMGNTLQIPQGLLTPARTLTAHIALEMGYAMGDHRAALFVTGGLLLTVVGVLILVVQGLENRKEPEQCS